MIDKGLAGLDIRETLIARFSAALPELRAQLGTQAPFFLNQAAALTLIDQVREIHMLRQTVLRPGPEDMTQLILSGDFTLLTAAKSAFHQIGPGNEHNLKWVSADGLQEFVYRYEEGGYVLLTDANDPVNVGTYNYASPDDATAHLWLDVVPWILWGNGPNDTTTLKTRLEMQVTGAFGLLDEILNKPRLKVILDYEIGSDGGPREIVIPQTTGNQSGTSAGETLTGDAMRNFLHGGGGPDILAGGAGADVLQGGFGNDTASYRGSLRPVIVDLARGEGMAGDAADRYGPEILLSIENVWGSDHGDIIIGNAGLNTLAGYSGADTIHAGEGADVLYGGFDSDRLHGGGGNDTLTGGAGDDSLYGGDGADVLTLTGGGGDTLWGDAGNDTFEIDAPGDEIATSVLLYGGDDDDYFVLRENPAGWIEAHGGAGDDVFDFAFRDPNESASIVPGSGRDAVLIAETNHVTITLQETFEHLLLAVRAGGTGAQSPEARLQIFAPRVVVHATEAGYRTNWGDVTVDEGVVINTFTVYSNRSAVLRLDDAHDSVDINETGRATVRAGGGNDFLVLRNTSATLTGGSGDDSFILMFGSEGKRVVITDFGRGADYLNVSGFSSNLDLAGIVAGAREVDGDVVYRGDMIHLVLRDTTLDQLNDLLA